MPEMKTVYFTKDGKWFENRDEAVRHELIEEVVEYVSDDVGYDLTHDIVEAILKRYKLEQRWDWVEPTTEENNEINQNPKMSPL